MSPQQHGLVQKNLRCHTLLNKGKQGLLEVRLHKEGRQGKVVQNRKEKVILQNEAGLAAGNQLPKMLQEKVENA